MPTVMWNVRNPAVRSIPPMTGLGRFETLGFNLFPSLHLDTRERYTTHAALTLMGLVIKLNGRDDGCGFVADHEVVTHTVDAVVPLVESEALLDTKNPRHLKLREDDVIGDWEAT